MKDGDKVQMKLEQVYYYGLGKFINFPSAQNK